MRATLPLNVWYKIPLTKKLTDPHVVCNPGKIDGGFYTIALRPNGQPFQALRGVFNTLSPEYIAKLVPAPLESAEEYAAIAREVERLMDLQQIDFIELNARGGITI
jgi:hypothetical protein